MLSGWCTPGTPTGAYKGPVGTQELPTHGGSQAGSQEGPRQGPQRVRRGSERRCPFSSRALENGHAITPKMGCFAHLPDHLRRPRNRLSHMWVSWYPLRGVEGPCGPPCPWVGILGHGGPEHIRYVFLSMFLHRKTCVSEYPPTRGLRMCISGYIL